MKDLIFIIMKNIIRPNQAFSHYPVPAKRNEPGPTSNAPAGNFSMQTESGSAKSRIFKRHPLQIALFAKMPFHGKRQKEDSASQSNNIDKYRKASIDQLSLMEKHFGKDELGEEKQGICRGMSLIWARLHQAKPSATAENRMNMLSSEAAVTHAIITQRLRTTDLTRDSGFGLKGDKPELATQAMRETNSKHVVLFPMTKRDIINFRKFLSEKAGYSTLTIVFTPDAAGSGVPRLPAHSISIYSEGKRNRPLTIFDPNLGEFQVPKKKLPSFFEGMSSLYKEDGLEMRMMTADKVEFTDDIRNTPLAHLVG